MFSRAPALGNVYARKEPRKTSGLKNVIIFPSFLSLFAIKH